MIEDIRLIVAPLGFLLLLSGFGFFLDKILRNEIKDKIYGHMNRSIFESADLSVLFRGIFDNVFAVRRNGKPGSLRSLTASYLLFSTLFVFWAMTYPERANGFLSVWASTIGILVLVLVINPIGDFCSLWQTRIVVGFMADARKGSTVIALLIADLLLTTVIFGVAAIVWRYFLDLYTYLIGYTPGGLFYIQQLFCRYTFTCRDLGMIFTDANTINDVIFILFCTTLLTSVWLWVFILGVLLWPVFRRLHRIVKVEKYPMGTAMTIGGLIVSPLIFCVGVVAVSYFGR